MERFLERLKSEHLVFERLLYIYTFPLFDEKDLIWFDFRMQPDAATRLHKEVEDQIYGNQKKTTKTKHFSRAATYYYKKSPT